MCFKNLPIEFDHHGRARLVEVEGGKPFSLSSPEKAIEQIVRGTHLQEFTIDPVTRIAGSMSFYTQVDLRARRVVEAYSEANVFRGYEVILKGRDPLDAIHISSRACGVCGGVHATCAAMALEMAFGVHPPPLALISRNLGEAAELVYDHTLHLFLLAGPDYSELVVSKTSPTLWAKAQTTPAPNQEIHGLATVADIMRGLNPLKGHLYVEALQITRDAREVASLTLGKYPHPSTIFPGGLGVEATPATFNQVFGRIINLIDYAKKVAALWDDLVDFFYAEVPGYARVGERPANLICTGMFDDAEVYDANYRNCREWGDRRLVTAGAMVGGELRSTDLDLINAGIEEFVCASYYEDWKGDIYATDPSGNPLSPFNPWNKETVPKPTGRNWKERYSWSTAPRWDREPMETGPLARHWITAMAGKIDNEFIRVVNDGLEIDLPRGESAERTLHWKIPPRVNTLERNRARAYHVGYCGMVAYTYLLQAFDYLQRGHTEMSVPYTIPKEGMGVGFWEAGRGTLTHHLQLEGGKLANYQIITPSTWMASPKDPFGIPGPYEEAILNTPLLEEFDSEASFTGIDILRTIRSFDPCMPCAVHMDTGSAVLTRDTITCICGQEEV